MKDSITSLFLHTIMVFRFFFYALAGCFFCLNNSVWAYSPTLLPTSMNMHIRPKVHKFIRSIETEKSQLQGIAMAILYKGRVVYKITSGYQRGNSGPITTRTLFPVGSVSKPISATALALLVDKGKIQLEQPLKLPYLAHKVHLKHILSHTTGYHFSGNLQIERGWKRAQILKTLAKETPKCQPGKCYFYSNTTYSLIEEMLNSKQLSLQKAISQLRSTLKTDGIQLVPLQSHLPFAYPHQKAEGQKKRSLPFPPYYPRSAPAAAGVFASLDGLISLFKLQFGYRPDLISNRTLNTFYTPVIINHDMQKWRNIDWAYSKHKIKSYYGLGWRILKAHGRPGKDLIFHSGYISGISAFVGYLPAEEIGIIILSNQESGLLIRKALGFWSQSLR
jgi:beta-lactamase class C